MNMKISEKSGIVKTKEKKRIKMEIISMLMGIMLLKLVMEKSLQMTDLLEHTSLAN
jgi:hypothetical protein